MKKSLLVVALCAFAIFGTGATALAQDTVQLTSSLNGASEVGDPGDLAGSGSATVTIDAASNEVCFNVSYSDIDEVAGGHIHSGGAGSNGDVVVDFALDATKTEGCITGEAATVASILASPELFYVNVHTGPFPGGAIRGQLSGPPAAAAPAATATPEATATPAADDAAATTTEAPAATTTEELAFTGDMTGFLAIAGAALLVTGGGMVVAARRRS